MSKIDFYAIVRILPSSQTHQLGVAGKTGVVVGHSGSLAGDVYAVLVAGEACMVAGSDLLPTGEILERDAIYTGDSLSVPAEPSVGEAGGYPNE